MIARRMTVLTLVLASTSSLAAQDPQATFRTSTTRVSVDVSVRREGRPVTGLAATDFGAVRQRRQAERHRAELRAAADRRHRRASTSAQRHGSLLDQLRRVARAHRSVQP